MLKKMISTLEGTYEYYMEKDGRFPRIAKAFTWTLGPIVYVTGYAHGYIVDLFKRGK